jgi:hypothetical protein
MLPHPCLHFAAPMGAHSHLGRKPGAKPCTALPVGLRDHTDALEILVNQGVWMLKASVFWVRGENRKPSSDIRCESRAPVPSRAVVHNLKSEWPNGPRVSEITAKPIPPILGIEIAITRVKDAYSIKP